MTEYAAYSAMILDADPATGIWVGSARALAFLFNCTLSERAARRALDGLAKNPEGAYIKRFPRPGSHGNYPILINRFDCTAGARSGMRLNADATTDWREPVYYDPRGGGEEENGGGSPRTSGPGVSPERSVVDATMVRGEELVKEGASRLMPLSADITTSWLGLTPCAPHAEIDKSRESGEDAVEEGSFIRKGTRVRHRIEKENTKKPKARKPPSEALPIFELAKEYAHRTWQVKFGSKPTWGVKDFSGLARVLRRHRELPLPEFRARWDRYLQDRDPFAAKMGYSLAYFCARFDAYIDRSGLDVPELTPYEDT